MPFGLPKFHFPGGTPPQLQVLWVTLRSLLPDCGEAAEKMKFAKGGQQGETEMAHFGGQPGQEGGQGYTSFGGEDDAEGGISRNRKVNGSLSGIPGSKSVESEFGGSGAGELAIKGKISEWQAGYNVTNAIQGMFIVSLPAVVLNGGYWGLFAIVFVAYICCHTGKVLIECLYEEDETGSKVRVRSSYKAIAETVFGQRFGGKLVSGAQMIELLMTCILYVVLCGDMMNGSFPGGRFDTSEWMLISGMFLLPCAFLKTLKSVSMLSLWCAVVHLFINIIIMGYCLTHISHWAWGKVKTHIDFHKFPISLGVVVFGYTSHIFLPTMEGSLKDRSRFNCMLEWSHIAAAVFKGLFAYVCFLTWALETEDEITNNLGSVSTGFRAFINFILVVKALLSYPLPYYAAVDMIEVSFFKGKPDTLFPSCLAVDGELRVWSLGLRLLLVVFTIFMAIIIPHFSILMGFVGSFTGTMLSFVWPAYFHLKIKWETLSFYYIVLDVFIIGLGVVCGVNGMYNAGVALVEAYNLKTFIPTT